MPPQKPWIRLLVAGAVCFATTPVAHAYTIKYLDDNQVKKVHWNDDVVGLTLDSSVHSFLPGNGGARAVQMAIDAWRLPGLPELSIVSGNAPSIGYHESGDANGVYVLSEDDWNARGLDNKLAVTVSTFDSGSGRLLDTDVLINEYHPYSLLDEMPNSEAANDTTAPDLVAKERLGTYDLGAVVTHELGHVLGLGESMEAPIATMWPTIGTDEVFQRTISNDDEMGVGAIYENVPLSAPSGCGGATVSGRSIETAWIPLLVLAMLLGLVLFRWKSDNREGVLLRGTLRARRPATGLLFAAAVMAIGPIGGDGVSKHEGSDPLRVRVFKVLSLGRAGDLEVADLQKAMRDDAPEVRMAAAAVLGTQGSFEDQELAAELATDPDKRVREVALGAYDQLKLADPRYVVSGEEGQKRFEDLTRGAATVFVGVAAPQNAELRNGMIWTTYEVRGANGRAERVQIAGGTVGGITQVVGGSEPPSEGSEILVAKHASGAAAWALHRRGTLWSGGLNHGPGITGVEFPAQ